jgi:DNA-directed RNA polymerase subunit E'/Rpb7
MFYKVRLQQIVHLEPQLFRPDIRDQVQVFLRINFEGAVLPEVGQIICISDIGSLTAPETVMPIQRTTGLCPFRVSFTAVVARPAKYEVIDAQVTRIDHLGMYLSAGPATGFIASGRLEKSGYRYDPQLLAFAGANGSLREHSMLRIKMLGVNINQGHMSFTAETA